MRLERVVIVAGISAALPRRNEQDHRAYGDDRSAADAAEPDAAPVGDAVGKLAEAERVQRRAPTPPGRERWSE